MVVHDSFVVRKPLEFTLIVLFIVFLLLLPVYFYTKHTKAEKKSDILVPETYSEVWYYFSPDSDLSDSDKRLMFKLKYENNLVQWTGSLRACEQRAGLSTVSIDERGQDSSDVLFTTQQDCTNIPSGSQVTYKMRLVDWKIMSFIGKDGEIISWG